MSLERRLQHAARDLREFEPVRPPLELLTSQTARGVTPASTPRSARLRVLEFAAMPILFALAWSAISTTATTRDQVPVFDGGRPPVDVGVIVEPVVEPAGEPVVEPSPAAPPANLTSINSTRPTPHGVDRPAAPTAPVDHAPVSVRDEIGQIITQQRSTRSTSTDQIAPSDDVVTSAVPL